MAGNAIVKGGGGVMQLLQMKKDSLARVATKHLTAERLITSIGLAASRNPDLMKCTPDSMLKAAMSASQLGLDPSGSLGSAYLVPYFNGRIRALEAVFIPGYRGLIDLLRRHCDAQVEARLVYSNDKFRVTYGTTPMIEHEPALDGEEADDAIVAAYSVFTWPDGRKSFEVMSRAEIEKVRKSSRAGEGGPWKQWYGEMCKKTVVRRGVKLQPLSPEAQSMIEKADESEHGAFEVVAEVEARAAQAEQDANARLKDRLAEKPGMDGDAEVAATETPKAAERPAPVNNAGPAQAQAPKPRAARGKAPDPAERVEFSDEDIDAALGG